ncbi:Gag-Pol polyprotein [Cyphomyrmex costatus]|uniref:Gag-Pol polyprotein n=1 Tax=Cyphomyrmex costatus TaxID=456900 RepID=A0A151K221_9HYME|nr:Gag-Pol polyprotein [Cyphomyrmex costatus]
MGLQCGPRRCERATQTDPPEPPRRTIGRGGGNVGEERCARCQREEQRVRAYRTSRATSAVAREKEARIGDVASPDAGACWNCGRTGHRYSTCPRARREFCFGCGRPGVTLRTCTRCQGRWRSLGPYHPVRGHDLRCC